MLYGIRFAASGTGSWIGWVISDNQFGLYANTAGNAIVVSANTADALFDGVMSQTRRPDRWIVADDGSSDGTFEVLAGRAALADWDHRRAPRAGRAQDCRPPRRRGCPPITEPGARRS